MSYTFMFEKFFNRIIDRIIDKYLNKNKSKNKNELEFDIIYKDKIRISLKGKDLMDIGNSLINIFSSLKPKKRR